MKTTIKFLLLLLCCLPASAQFRRTSDNRAYPYTNTMLASDVFIIGRPGVTNYNFAFSNLARFMTNAATSVVNSTATNSQTPWLSDINGAQFSLTNVNRLNNGSNAISTVGTYSHAEGGAARSVGTFSHAEGFQNNANGAASHAEGHGTTTSGSYAHAEGETTVASGRGAHSAGLNTKATGYYSVADGLEGIANGYASQAHGQGTANADYSYLWTGIHEATANRYYTNDTAESYAVFAAGGITLASQSNNIGLHLLGTDVIALDGTRFVGNASGVSNATTLIAGSNTTITTNADGRTFTIASSGGGSGVNVAAGTNVTSQTNSGLVTINAQPRTYVAAGTNVSLLTNGALVTVSAVLSSPVTATSYTNSTGILISDSGPATPYPSSITASGIVSDITSVSVAINGFNHNKPDDIAIILISPSSHQIKLMEATGSSSLPGGPGNYADLVFSDSAPDYVPATLITSGSYLPTVRGSVGTPTAPATGPYYTNLSVLHGTSPNGSWGLYVYDGIALDGGRITNWSVTINSGNADYARLSDPTNHFLGDAGWDGEVSFASGSMGSVATTTLNVSGTLTSSTSTSGVFTVTQSIISPFTNAYVFAGPNGELVGTNNGSGLTNLSLIMPAQATPPNLTQLGAWMFSTGTNVYFVIKGGNGVLHTNKVTVTADTFP